LNGRAYGRYWHSEVRGTYLLGEAPLARIGFAPLIFIGGGMAEFDGHVTGQATLSNVVGQHRVNIWITDAPWFVTAGGGFRYQFSIRTALTAAVRANASFPGNGLLPTFGPEIGFQYGF